VKHMDAQMYTDVNPQVKGLLSSEMQKGLDALCLGLFRINQDGYIDEFNDTAGEILGVDEYTAWEDLHVIRVDRFLGIGLADKIAVMFENGESFVRAGVSCTNSRGRFMVLNICCVPAGGDKAEILGIVADLGGCEDRLKSPSSPFAELRILTEVSAALSSSYELDQVLKVILTAATASQGLGFNRAFLLWYDSSGNCLHGHLAVGPSSAEEADRIWRNLDSMQLTLSELLNSYEGAADHRNDALTELIADLQFDLGGDSIIAEVCEAGSWVNLERRRDVDGATGQFLARLGTNRVVLVPLKSKGKLLGLLAADNFITNRQISDDSAQLLQLLANQAAVAMEKARLYDEQRERAAELERINALLAESQDQIIRIEKMSIIGQLTSVIAHELRNPLTIIGGFANLMLKSDITDDTREYLNIIASETKRTESVLDHVLDFHKASQRENGILDFSDLVEKNLGLFLGRRHRSNIRMALFRSGEPLPVYGNRDQLSHAVYQMFMLVGEELIPPGAAEVRTESRAGMAVMVITFDCGSGVRERLVRTLKQVFTDTKASQRLVIMVAGETIKHHGGNYGIATNGGVMPSIYMELPLVKEATDG